MQLENVFNKELQDGMEPEDLLVLLAFKRKYTSHQPPRPPPPAPQNPQPQLLRILTIILVASISVKEPRVCSYSSYMNLVTYKRSSKMR